MVASRVMSSSSLVLVAALAVSTGATPADATIWSALKCLFRKQSPEALVDQKDGTLSLEQGPSVDAEFHPIVDLLAGEEDSIAEPKPSQPAVPSTPEPAVPATPGPMAPESGDSSTPKPEPIPEPASSAPSALQLEQEPVVIAPAEVDASAQIILYSFIGLLVVMFIGAMFMYCRLRTIKKGLASKYKKSSLTKTLTAGSFATESHPFVVVKDLAYKEGDMPEYDSTTDDDSSEDERDIDSESDSDSDSDFDDEKPIVSVSADERV